MAKPRRIDFVLFLAGVCFAAPVYAAIWPEQFGVAKRVSAQPSAIVNRQLWSEYGLQEAEQAEYAAGAEKFTATAYRLQDSTGALGAFEWQRPKNAKQSQLGSLAAETDDETILAKGNYLFIFQRYKPLVSQIGALVQALPNLDQAPLPTLQNYLPAEGRIPNSERYVIGPAGLQSFAPAIPAGVAAFHLGAEAQIADFRAPGGEMRLGIFSYPTPNIARERLAEMQKLPGSVAKRSGPLVAVALSGGAAPSNANDAEWLLSLVKYQAVISWDQHVPTRRDNIGVLIVNAFTLIGILLACATASGIAFGGFRAFSRRGGRPDPDALTVLHLSD